LLDRCSRVGQQSWVSVFAGMVARNRMLSPVARSRMLSPVLDREAAPMLQP